MTKSVRFNFESLPAADAIYHSERLWADHWPARAIGSRAQALFLHWWGVGHNPARHVLACPDCEGSGNAGAGYAEHPCPWCHGERRVARTDAGRPR